MHTVNFEEVVEGIVGRDSRYAREAYHFVREALDHTQRRVHQEIRSRKDHQDRHVTGQQLLDGIREYGVQAFGPMTLFVLGEWGIHRCEDFGEIVFNLVEYGQGMFGKTEQDSRDDFRGAYTFEEAFRAPFLPSPRVNPAPSSTPPA